MNVDLEVFSWVKWRLFFKFVLEKMFFYYFKIVIIYKDIGNFVLRLEYLNV